MNVLHAGGIMSTGLTRSEAAVADTFDRDATAAFYAKRHKQVDPSVLQIHYLPTGSPANEIRFVEVNRSIAGTAHPEPVDFGVDGGTPNAHKLIVLDVTPHQWGEIHAGRMALPPGWDLDGCQELGSGRPRKRR